MEMKTWQIATVTTVSIGLAGFGIIGACADPHSDAKGNFNPKVKVDTSQASYQNAPAPQSPDPAQYTLCGAFATGDLSTENFAIGLFVKAHPELTTQQQADYVVNAVKTVCPENWDNLVNWVHQPRPAEQPDATEGQTV